MNEKAIKWIVVGVIILVSIVVFRGEIGELIGRIKEIHVSSKEIKVVTTPIGDTTVSAQSSSEKVYTETAESEPNTHMDRQHKFLISWPIDSEWIPSNKLSQSQRAELGLPGKDPSNLPTFFVFKFDTPSSPHAGMVNVFAHPSSLFNNDIQDLIDSHKKGLEKNNVTVLSSTIDGNTGGAVLVARDGETGWTGVNRLLVGDTYSYIINMRFYPPGEEYAELRAGSKMIFNSFRILK
jgi:hypothetical protein